jgi:hypothetical protein
MTEEKIKGLIDKESARVKRRAPFISDLKLSVLKTERGEFTSQTFFKSGKKFITIKTKARCPEALIKKSFSKIINLVTRRKNKSKSAKRLNFTFQEAA